eukprot:scaffold607125_cov32-Prasinocladus_malaysianus.AAC.2
MPLLVDRQVEMRYHGLTFNALPLTTGRCSGGRAEGVVRIYQSLTVSGSTIDFSCFCPASKLLIPGGIDRSGRQLVQFYPGNSVCRIITVQSVYAVATICPPTVDAFFGVWAVAPH